MRANKIGEHVYADTSGEGKGNIGAIELPSFTIVIDSTISRNTASAFRSSLESQTKSPIRKLVITHYHADHTLGIPVFRDCDIIASEQYKKLRRTPKYRSTQSFEERLVLEDRDFSVEIVHSGGHTQDSSYVFFPQEKTLFSGDLIFAGTFFYAGDSTFNPDEWTRILRLFLKMDVEKIVPGHGSLCGKEEVKTYLKFFETTSSRMKELVESGATKREAMRVEGLPTFYPEYREGIREQALANWYRFYKTRYTRRNCKAC